MSYTGTTPICAHCGLPVRDGDGTFIGGGYYHWACSRSPYEQLQPMPLPLEPCPDCPGKDQRIAELEAEVCEVRETGLRLIQDNLRLEAMLELGHVERIRCYECQHEQLAIVEHGQPFNTYIHTCVRCGYIIMESVWEQVKDGAK